MYFSASVPHPVAQAKAPGKFADGTGVREIEIPPPDARGRLHRCDCGRLTNLNPVYGCRECRRLDGVRLEGLIIDAMRGSPGPATIADLVEMTGAWPESLQRCLARMLASGRVRRFWRETAVTVRMPTGRHAPGSGPYGYRADAGDTFEGTRGRWAYLLWG